ncbi:hypothetical protein JW979_10200 [bacterium]|nr:hypothetical protein [candidate division CSSED10-310 bacterium]
MYKILDSLILPLKSCQILDQNNSDLGAIDCAACQCTHTRAAEAVFPFAVSYSFNPSRESLTSTLLLGDWLIKHQQSDGSWKETPQEWNGTTVFQLMSMAAAQQVIRAAGQQTGYHWDIAIKKAAEWIVEHMSDRKTNINYSASGAAALALTTFCLSDKRLEEVSDFLAQIVLSYINNDNLLVGEGPYLKGFGRIGIDPGYNVEMSYGALALYAKLRKRFDILERLVEIVKTNLWFIFPDGSLDGSWGSRGYKWTGYGSKTAHGAILTLGLLAEYDPVFKAYFTRVLMCNKESILDNGMFGYGPHHRFFNHIKACNYPTFNRANALAFAIQFGNLPDSVPKPDLNLPLPENEDKIFPSINIIELRKKTSAISLSALTPLPIQSSIIMKTYDFFKNHRLPVPGFLKSKITDNFEKLWNKLDFHRPSGGALTYWWHEAIGAVQLANSTKYIPIEKMHMPAVGDQGCITPRLEYSNGFGIYSNLYEIDASYTIKEDSNQVITEFSGHLRKDTFARSGISYILRYCFENDCITKTWRIHGPATVENITIYEPIVFHPMAAFEKSENHVAIFTSKGTIELKLEQPNLSLRIMQPVLSLFPFYRVLPIILSPKNNPDNKTTVQTYSYRLIIN